MHDVLSFAADEAEDGGPDQDARDQIPQYGAETQARGNGGSNHGGGEIDEGADEKFRQVHGFRLSRGTNRRAIWRAAPKMKRAGNFRFQPGYSSRNRPIGGISESL